MERQAEAFTQQTNVSPLKELALSPRLFSAVFVAVPKHPRSGTEYRNAL